MLNLTKDELTRFMKDIWELSAGMEIELLQETNHLVKAACYESGIKISGLWNGMEHLKICANHAIKLAQVIFSEAERKINKTMFQDVVGEMINIVGGHIKSMLPDPCNLSLPIINNGAEENSSLLNNDILWSSSYIVDNEIINVILFIK